jgi:hypothetical protein
MCLICVEFNKKRMTKTELNKALPEMVMFAKNEEERSHFKKLQILSNSTDDTDLSSFTDEHAKDHGKKTS